MGKSSTIVAVVALALLMAGIVLAVIRLYKTGSGETSASAAAPAGWSVLKAVPSDANAVLVFDGSAKAARILADSTGFVRGIVAPENPAFMDFLSAQGRHRMAVSLHNSGSLVPLVAVETDMADSLALDIATRAGLKTRQHGGFLLASRSETFLNASARHLEEVMSVLSTDKLEDLVAVTSGSVSFFFSHTHAAKILQVYTPAKMRRKASFVKDLTAWSSLVVQESDPDHILLKGSALPGEAPASWLAAFEGLPVQEAAFPEEGPFPSRGRCGFLPGKPPPLRRRQWPHHALQQYAQGPFRKAPFSGRVVPEPPAQGGGEGHFLVG